MENALNTLSPERRAALQERLASVRNRVAEAARAAGRKAEDVTLVAVSKTHPAEAVAVAHALGQVDFGENYVQEVLAKQEALAALPLRWHFIGHLQSNKAKFVTGRFCLIHTVDSMKLAQNLHKHLDDLAPGGLLRENNTHIGIQEILIQVNIGNEEQKSGVDAAGLPALAESVMGLENLRLVGLMCIPPLSLGPAETRPYFARLRELKDGLEREIGHKLPHLSMGMSQDFETAIAEGATLARVGTDIFGLRDYGAGA